MNNDRRVALELLAKEAQRAAECGDMKELFMITSKLSAEGQKVSVPVKNKLGVPLTSTTDQAERFREHKKKINCF